MELMPQPDSDEEIAVRAAVIEHVRRCLDAAPVLPAYRSALGAALRLPGNLLSGDPDARWARLVWTCCQAVAGDAARAVAVAAAGEMFMVALDILDDLEDEEPSPLLSTLSSARILNLSTGLLLIAQHSLLGSESAAALRLLLSAALRACSGQDADLTGQDGPCLDLDAALQVSAAKSAALTAALCQLGALCGGADAALQAGYAQFGWYLGMIAQLGNDVVGIAPDAAGKTDLMLQRPTLPLTYAARYLPIADADADAALRSALWAGGAAHLAWVVAETYRAQARSLVPTLTIDAASRARLTALLPMLCWMHPQGG